MIVDKDLVDRAISDIKSVSVISLDTETTGIRPYAGSRLFSIIIAGDHFCYYFNFQSAPDIEEKFVLGKDVLDKLRDVLADPKYRVFIHNAKFDLAILHNEGIEIAGTVHCTMTVASIEYNEHHKYDLSSCAKRIGLEPKDDVDKYITQNKLYERITTLTLRDYPKTFVNKFYNKIPFSIIVPYAEKDAILTYKLGIHQLASLPTIGKKREHKGKTTVMDVLPIECKLTKVVLEMERYGITIDRNYCNDALHFYHNLIVAEKRRFEEVTGFGFIDSGKQLGIVFHHLGYTLPKTERGNNEVKQDALLSIDHEAARIVLNIREYTKRITTYFVNFMLKADKETNVIHFELKQIGAKTHRFSCSNPNFQNLTKRKDKEAKYPVRKAIIPPKDHIFVMIDYDQMEFRLMLEYANQEDLIAKINEGFDPHQATADQTKLERSIAKSINFGILYGMGVKALAVQLGTSMYKARLFRSRYFRALPKVRNFLALAAGKGSKWKEVYSWDGRRFVIPKPKFGYRAPNRVISGGCAGIVKIAMIKCHEFLKDYKSKMILQVHDELLFAVHKSEFHIIPQLKKLMESAYPYKRIPLTCSVSHSYTSWAEEVEGMPEGAEREFIQTQSEKGSFEAGTGLSEGVVSKNSGSYSEGSSGHTLLS